MIELGKIAERLERLNELEKIAERLARSLGHQMGCKYVSGQHCDRGCGKDQAAALDQYERWKAAANAKGSAGRISD
jgi:hypothetical protein